MEKQEIEKLLQTLDDKLKEAAESVESSGELAMVEVAGNILKLEQLSGFIRENISNRDFLQVFEKYEDIALRTIQILQKESN